MILYNRKFLYWLLQINEKYFSLGKNIYPIVIIGKETQQILIKKDKNLHRFAVIKSRYLTKVIKWLK